MTILKKGRPKLDKPKALISIRLDSDIVEYLRSSGDGWQTRINNTLRKLIDDKEI